MSVKRKCQAKVQPCRSANCPDNNNVKVRTLSELKSREKELKEAINNPKPAPANPKLKLGELRTQREKAASYKRASKLHELVSSDDVLTRVAVAKNENTSLEDIETLANDENNDVSAAANASFTRISENTKFPPAHPPFKDCPGGERFGKRCNGEVTLKWDGTAFELNPQGSKFIVTQNCSGEDDDDVWNT